MKCTSSRLFWTGGTSWIHRKEPWSHCQCWSSCQHCMQMMVILVWKRLESRG